MYFRRENLFDCPHARKKIMNKTGPLVVVVALALGAVYTSAAQEQQRKINYAVMAIKNAEGVTSGNAEVIADRLRAELFKTGRANIMERDQMQEILKEQGFQQSGACTDQACMVELGQMLGVERLVSGSIGKLGSLYLVNFRAIDVKTGKIVKVVSIDIRGGIEDVVVYLPKIAHKLAAAEDQEADFIDASAADQPLDAPDMREPVVGSEPEERVATGFSEDEPADEDRGADDADDNEEEANEDEADEDREALESDGRNSNRSGIRLCFMAFSGELDHTWSRMDSVIATDEEFGFTDHSAFISTQIRFMIRTGRFLVIEIGPGFSTGRESVYDEMHDEYSTLETQTDLHHYIVSLETGLNFVWRFYPLKLNGGIMLDIGFAASKFTGSTREYGYNQYSSYELIDESSNEAAYRGIAFGYGLRTGAEILAGPHVGFAVDLLIRPLNLFTSYTPESESGYEDPIINHASVSPAGLGLSVNFYY